MDTPSCSRVFGRALRVSLAVCFAAHGGLAFAVHEPWIGLYTALGLSEPFARVSMPAIGVLDALVALMLVWRPTRIVFAWAAAWTLLTAAVRVAAGLGVEELLVRGINWGPALALLLAARTGWTARVDGPSATPLAALALAVALASTVVGAWLGAALWPAHPSLVTLGERAGLLGILIALVAFVAARAGSQRATQVSSTSSSKST